MSTPSRMRRRCLGLVAALVVGSTLAPVSQAPTAVVLIVVDGLRPDQVTPDVMPRLTALGGRGMVFERHHSVSPTVTRVNASSIATGTYPETHGLLGNTVYSAPPKTLKGGGGADKVRDSEAEGA